MKLVDLIEMNARAALAQQEDDGSLPAGHNGPHGHQETPVRNTAHWLVTFARLYRWTGEPKWREAVHRAASFLTSGSVRPHGFTFHHRDSPGKDRCNGLIGPAWTFEALAEAADVLADERFVSLAEEVFFQHPFDESRGLWQVVDVDGRVLSFDGTFNHQLWFAATASLLHGPSRQRILERAERFLSRCDRNLTIHPDGLIFHAISARRLARTARRRLAIELRQAVNALPVPGIRRRTREARAKLLEKSVGYQTFNLHALGMLRPQIPDHRFWKSERLERAVGYLDKVTFVKSLEHNPYGYPYNPPGFEVAFALMMLRDLPEEELLRSIATWIDRQMRHTLETSSGQLARNTPDARTLTARLYEVTLLPKSLLDQIEFSYDVSQNVSRRTQPAP